MYFFFSSRRRHTRLQGDWSSDVCSSDLLLITDGAKRSVARQIAMPNDDVEGCPELVGHGSNKFGLRRGSFHEFLVGLLQLGSFLLYLGKKPSVLDRHSDGVSDGFEELKVIRGKMMSHMIRNMQSSIDLVTGFDGKSGGRPESQRRHPVTRAYLLVMGIILEIVKYHRQPRLKDLTADTPRDGASIHRLGRFRIETLVRLETQVLLRGIQNINPARVEGKGFDNFFHRLLKNNIEIQRMTYRRS